MHELTICETLLDTLDHERQSRGFRRVRRVRLEVGQFSCLDADALRYAFDIMTRDTFVEGAVLEIDQPPGRVTCLDCGAESEVDTRLSACPVCGAHRVKPTGGDQMRFVEMEIA